MPETFDLDEAFRALEHDISTRSLARGASAAIGTARRRRRTTVGGLAAAVALVVIGGVAVAQGVGTHSSSVEPAGLPSPAPYDNHSLSQATKGWTGDWTRLRAGNLAGLRKTALGPHCLAKMVSAIGRSTPNSTRSGGGIAVSPGAEVARSWLTGWSDDHSDAARSAYPALVSAFAACAQASPAHSYLWVDARARSWDVTGSASQAQHLWVAQADDAVAILWMGGSAGAVPNRVDRRVAHALVAGLQSPASFLTNGQMTGFESSAGSATSSP
jgi:hypothetical protein